MLDFACVDPSDFVKNKTETKDRSCEWFTSRSIIILFSLDAFEAVYIMTFWSVSVRGELICFQFIDMLLTSLRQRLGALFHLPSAPANSKPYNSPKVTPHKSEGGFGTKVHQPGKWTPLSTALNTWRADSVQRRHHAHFQRSVPKISALSVWIRSSLRIKIRVLPDSN